MTSGELVLGTDERSSLDIECTVAATLVTFLQSLQTKPRYIIAKAEITRSDTTTKGLDMEREMISEQAAVELLL